MRGNPVMQIRGSSVLLYEEPVRLYSGLSSIKRRQNMKLQQAKQYSGAMSVGARKRMAKAITIMTQACKPKWIANPITGKSEYHTFSFITLTVASDKLLSARQGYDLLLAPFLDWMRKTARVKTYIWKAELQLRGQIHYHITTPSWIHHREISQKWNYLQREAGLLDDYAKKHGHFNPPSTDIHRTYNVKKMDSYLVKELMKSVSALQVKAITEVNNQVERGELDPETAEEKIQEIQADKMGTIGKIWGCSSDLSGVSYFTVDLTTRHLQQLEQWTKEKMIRMKGDDFYAIYFFDDVDPPDLLDRLEQSAFERHLDWVMNRNEAKEDEIPAACVDMQHIDVQQPMTWQQIEIVLN